MYSSLLKLSSLLLMLVSVVAQAGDLREATDLKRLGDQHANEVIVLMVSQPDCAYCVRVKSEFLEPLLKTEAAPPVEVINLGTHHSLIGFDGQPTTAEALSAQFNAHFTPTLLFLDAQGTPVHEPMIGLTTPEFYGYYLDEAIRLSRQQLN